MSFIIPSIILSIISLPLYFLFSSEIAGWFVWGVFLILSIYLFVESFKQYNSMLKGEPKTIGDVAGIASYPFTTSIIIIILIVLIFIDINKLHLLWICPVISFIFEFTIGKRATNVSHPDILKEIHERKKHE